jgi:hypothetical protein
MQKFRNLNGINDFLIQKYNLLLINNTNGGQHSQTMSSLCRNELISQTNPSLITKKGPLMNWTSKLFTIGSLNRASDSFYTRSGRSNEWRQVIDNEVAAKQFIAGFSLNERNLIKEQIIIDETLRKEKGGDKAETEVISSKQIARVCIQTGL